MFLALVSQFLYNYLSTNYHASNTDAYDRKCELLPIDTVITETVINILKYLFILLLRDFVKYFKVCDHEPFSWGWGGGGVKGNATIVVSLLIVFR